MDKLHDELFFLTGFMLNSARGLYEEKPEYGIFRLMDASTRLLNIMQAHALTDEFLDDVTDMLNEEISSSMDDVRQRETLEKIVALFTAEMQKRLNESIE
ncbi:MAG: DUF6092 family protein [Anaerolineae bacterium]|nr:DUF6092 family protein [Anaerolineae bacterium]